VLPFWAWRSGPVVSIGKYIAAQAQDLDHGRLLEFLQILFVSSDGRNIVLPRLKPKLTREAFISVTDQLGWHWIQRRQYRNARVE
jgi:hypothetical protein